MSSSVQCITGLLIFAHPLSSSLCTAAPPLNYFSHFSFLLIEGLPECQERPLHFTVVKKLAGINNRKVNDSYLLRATNTSINCKQLYSELQYFDCELRFSHRYIKNIFICILIVLRSFASKTFKFWPFRWLMLSCLPSSLQYSNLKLLKRKRIKHTYLARDNN